MVEITQPRQRVWFRLRDGLDRERAFDAAAGLLLRRKPPRTAIASFELYPPGDGAGDDPAVVTFMWELQYVLDDEDGRDGNWGTGANEALASDLRRALSDGRS